MIVRFARPGASFKGVAAYLTHDPEHASTSERVAWTHTLNLAHDHVPSSVHEMLTTCLDADLLKAEAGVRTVGRKVEKPVKHVSLNWHPSEKPERADMVRAAESFLDHMGWKEHQAILVAHDDKEHRHVHLIVNAIHPVTGLKLDDGLEKRRAQAWALAYEQQQGKVFCEQRLKPVAEREANEPRPAWLTIREQVERELIAEKARNEFAPALMSGIDIRRGLERNEWEILKQQQKDERLAFFAEGKQAYKTLDRALYREVREEFRPQWASYYAAKRDGLEPSALADIRAGLIARQKEALEERRKEPVAELREQRDRDYRVLLDMQKQERAELIDRQERGLRSPHLLDRAYPSPEREEAGKSAITDVSPLDRFGIRRGRVIEGEPVSARNQGMAPGRAAPPKERSFTQTSPAPSSAPSRDLASGLAGGLLSIIGALGESMVGGHTKPPRPPPQEIDPLERFGVKRGRPPDPAEEKARRDKAEREAWDVWKEKRDLERSRSG
ncbi:relaxase/mobilization nuclease domain-containing protein [Methylosinus sp. Sm6]|uniref:relaxase/mobilization nuclease domain-containing protein n=1 Tax=Methylosinus sp. Sm6 TaxID=2866948 RepID=UPI001C995FF4|nr:relaxase/mobilization nuclease domain-containing protein [Methylosinus sp. Sm6]MBY6240059.1 relaxase/mobilization nuclease domain-containing protein [Methylosinus sp. Sm6]